MRKTILDQSDAREIFDALLLHWSEANVLRERAGEAPIVLAGGYSRARFLNDAVAFEHLGQAIAEARAHRDAAAEDLANYKAGMRRALEKLSHLVHGHFAGAELSRAFPPLPDVRVAEGRFLDAVKRAADVWAKVDALSPREFHGPLVLSDGTRSADFATGVRLLTRAFAARKTAIERERTLRADRRALHRLLVGRAVQYRRVVLGLFPEESEIVRTFPDLWPKQVRGAKTREALLL